MNQILERLAHHLNPSTIGAWLAHALPKLIVGGLILALFYLIWRAVDRGLSALKQRMDPTIHSFFRSVGKITLLSIGVVTALGELGINVGSLLAGLGIAGLTLGFAAKDALSNIISGVFIFWDRPFVVGDLIEVGGYYGKVEDITLRTTRVVTVDGKMLAIPNSVIVNGTVASYTNFPHLRLDVRITVGTGEDLARIRQIFSGVVGDDQRYQREPVPEMVLVDVGDFNLTLEFRVWLADETQHIPARFALRERIFEALRAAGVEMPFETLQLAPFELKPSHAA